MKSSDIDLSRVVLSAQVRVTTNNRQSQSFHLASLLQVLCSQPVLCHLIEEALGMDFLSMFLAVSHGAWCMVGFRK